MEFLCPKFHITRMMAAQRRVGKRNGSIQSSQKRAKGQSSACSYVCSCHFAPEDFAETFVFATLKKKQRQLIKDDIWFVAVTRFQRNLWEEEEKLSHRSRRQVCNHLYPYKFSLSEKAISQFSIHRFTLPFFIDPSGARFQNTLPLKSGTQKPPPAVPAVSNLHTVFTDSRSE